MPKIERKLAEVMAFSDIGNELIKRGGKAFIDAFGSQTVREMTTVYGEVKKKIGDQADADKQQATVSKLRSMMEKYIGDEWDDSVELLEWSGFYLGAAIVHWALISAITDDVSLKQFARDAQHKHNDWLKVATRQIGVS